MDDKGIKEFLERIFGQNYQQLKEKKLRLTRVRIPGKELCFAHIISPSDERVYQNLGLHIGIHEGEDYRGKAIGILHFTPWESVIVAADVSIKAANVQIGFMDRFCGSLILTGELCDVEAAVHRVVEFFSELPGFTVCKIHKS